MSVYEFGPGKTYSTPQQALDALATDVGSTPFSETHILRGYTGVYTPPAVDEPILNIHTVEPITNIGDVYKDIWLKIEAAEGQSVKFEAGLVAVDADQRFMQNVWFKGIEVEVTENDARAFNLAYYNGGSWVYPDGFFYEDCNIHCDPSLTGTYGIYNSSYRNFVEVSQIRGFRTCIGMRDDVSDQAIVGTFCQGSIIESPEYAFYVNNSIDPQTLWALGLLGCTVRSPVGAYVGGDSWVLGLCATFNTICDHREDKVLVMPNLGIGGFFFYGDGSVFVVDEYFSEDKGGSQTPEYMMDWARGFLRAHIHSTAVAGDPDYLKLDDDLIPSEDSPAIAYGVGAPYLSFNGVFGSRGIVDTGAYQLSPIGYCTPNDAILMTGIQEEEFEELEGNFFETLNSWIAEASGIIERYTMRTWDPVPQGIKRACIMMTGNIIGLARQRRKLDAISPQDITLKTIRERESEILTDEVKEILNLFTEAKLGDGTEDYSNIGLGTFTYEDTLD